MAGSPLSFFAPQLKPRVPHPWRVATISENCIFAACDPLPLVFGNRRRRLTCASLLMHGSKSLAGSRLPSPQPRHTHQNARS